MSVPWVFVPMTIRGAVYTRVFTIQNTGTLKNSQFKQSSQILNLCFGLRNFIAIPPTDNMLSLSLWFFHLQNRGLLRASFEWNCAHKGSTRAGWSVPSFSSLTVMPWYRLPAPSGLAFHIASAEKRRGDPKFLWDTERIKHKHYPALQTFSVNSALVGRDGEKGRQWD